MAITAGMIAGRKVEAKLNVLDKDVPLSPHTTLRQQ
jgi:hypothetical protein